MRLALEVPRRAFSAGLQYFRRKGVLTGADQDAGLLILEVARVDLEAGPDGWLEMALRALRSGT